MPANDYIVEPADFREALETTKGLVILWKSKASAPGLDALRDFFIEMDGVTVLPEAKEWPKFDLVPRLSCHRGAPPPTVMFVDNPKPPPLFVKQHASLIVTCYPEVGDDKLVTIKDRGGYSEVFTVERKRATTKTGGLSIADLRALPAGAKIDSGSEVWEKVTGDRWLCRSRAHLPPPGSVRPLSICDMSLRSDQFADNAWMLIVDNVFAVEPTFAWDRINIQSDNQKTQLKALSGFIDYTDEAVTLLDAAGREFIKLTVAGDATVRGEKLAASQSDIYEMFRAWVQAVAKPPEPMANHDAAIQRDALVKAMDDMARLFRADGNHNGADFVEATRDFALRPPAAPKYTLRGTHSGRLSSAAPNESAKPMSYQGFSIKVDGKEVGRIREWKPGPLAPDAVGVTLSEPRREFFTHRSMPRTEQYAVQLLERLAAAAVEIPHSAFFALMAGDMNAVFDALGKCRGCRHTVPLIDGRCLVCTPLTDAERDVINKENG